VGGDLLSEGHNVIGYFYNPNIHPAGEYYRRLEAAFKVAEHTGYKIVEGEYDSLAWTEETRTFKDEPEGGKRCSICYRLRLEKTYKFMKETGYDGFTSTLTISPHKSAQIINNIGITIGKETFIARDFKKKDGFKKANELAKTLNLYRQQYCGCAYSLRDISSRGD
jgi:predicted adenine nucleotide alpha hydrolase (AANH) superfamily ATPase